MATANRTTTSADSAAIAALLDIDRALTQAHAIVRTLGACVIDALPSQTVQETAWAAGDLIRFANERAATLARIAQSRADAEGCHHG